MFGEGETGDGEEGGGEGELVKTWEREGKGIYADG